MNVRYSASACAGTSRPVRARKRTRQASHVHGPIGTPL